MIQTFLLNFSEPTVLQIFWRSFSVFLWTLASFSISFSPPWTFSEGCFERWFLTSCRQNQMVGMIQNPQQIMTIVKFELDLHLCSHSNNSVPVSAVWSMKNTKGYTSWFRKSCSLKTGYPAGGWCNSQILVQDLMDLFLFLEGSTFRFC